jgi:hypothetical protein
MRVEGFTPLAGVHAETASLRTVFAHAGIVAPHTGEPFSEAMLFGLGGGVGFMYFVFTYEGWPPLLALILRRHGKSGGYSGFVDRILRRTGVEASIGETKSAAAAQRALVRALRDGQPALCSVNEMGLPYLGIPDLLSGPTPPTLVVHGGTPYAIVVFGLEPDGGPVLVADRRPRPLRLARDELAAARGSVPALKHRLVTVAPPREAPDLRAAIREAIRNGCDGWLRPETTNFGFPALEKWAALLTDERDKRAWPRQFAAPAALFAGLTAVYHFIETDQTGGGALRGLQAAFLDEAADALGDPALRAVADRYREAATLWTDLARSALPDHVPALAESRQLTDLRLRRFAEGGDEVGDEMRTIWAKRDDAGRAFVADPWSDEERRALLARLATQVLTIHEVELDAVERLARIVG